MCFWAPREDDPGRIGEARPHGGSSSFSSPAADSASKRRVSTTGNANERFAIVAGQSSDIQIIQPGTRSARHGHVHLVSGPDREWSSRLNTSVVNGTVHAGEIDRHVAEVGGVARGVQRAKARQINRQFLTEHG